MTGLEIPLILWGGQKVWEWLKGESLLDCEGVSWTEETGVLLSLRFKDTLPKGAFVDVRLLTPDRELVKAADGFAGEEGEFSLTLGISDNGCRCYIPFGALKYTNGGDFRARIHVGRFDATTKKAERVGVTELIVSLPNRPAWSKVAHLRPLLDLTMLLVRADGTIDPKKLHYVRTQLESTFTLSAADLEELRMAMKIPPRYDVETLVTWTMHRMPTTDEDALLTYLSGIAKSDGDVSSGEAEIVRQVAESLGKTRDEWHTLSDTLGLRANDLWSLFGIPRGATLEEVKAAYRRLIKQYHPDRLVGFAQEWRDLAAKKTQELTEAYKVLLARFNQCN